jgi:hypothetical protein
LHVRVAFYPATICPSPIINGEEMRARIVFLLAMAMAIGISVEPLASATSIIFQENFEDYDEGSNLSDEDDWSGDRTLVGDGDHFGSMVANGRLRDGISGQAWSTHVFAEPLDVTNVYTLTFDAYATTESPEAHNSGVTFHSSDTPNVAGWWIANNPAAGADCPSRDFVGWFLDARYLAGGDNNSATDPYLYFASGGFDQVVTLSVIIDPINLEVYGAANLGSGPLETPHYPIIPDRFLNISGVSLEQDYRLGGAEFDNIVLSATPIPEPATVFLLGSCLVGLAGFRKRLGRSR